MYSQVFNEKEQYHIKMPRFIKKVFVVAMTFFGCNVLNINPLKCVSMNNKKYETRPQIINININERSFILTILK